MLTNPDNKANITFVNILLTGLLAGTLDAIAAVVWNYKIKAVIIFQFIASGVFGKAAFAGGADMVLWGLLFHYTIAMIFTAAFYLAYPLFYSIFRNKYIVGVEFGLLTWMIMNLIVVPLSKIGHGPHKLGAILSGMIILIICIGLPVALIADKVKRSRKS
jgi:hypothetical protein